MSTNKTKNNKRVYLDMNVILTFDLPNAYGERQEFFDLRVPISTKDTNAIEFIHNKFFKRIAKKCELYKRNTNELVKISTASNWGLYEEVTKAESLTALGHNCKWHFGMNRDDLDEWETQLMNKFGFGTNVDMSWLQQFIDERNKAIAQSKAKSA